MKDWRLDEPTRQELDRIAARVLKDAGFKEPPIDIRRILEVLSLDQEFYRLDDPGLLRTLRHRVLIGSRQLSEISKKIKLKALLLFDDGRVLLDEKLPEVKHEWALGHEAGHKVIPWHQEFARGDTLLTLEDWHDQLEAEANHVASALLFCGEVFSADARELPVGWTAIEKLKKRHSKNLTTTAQRYVREGPNVPMVLLVSTAPWDEVPENQVGPIRHLVLSRAFEARFPAPEPKALLGIVNRQAQKRRGGPVADFPLTLRDVNQEIHSFQGQSFYNRYYLITLIVLQSRTSRATIVLR